jgi:hypothetical protein
LAAVVDVFIGKIVEYTDCGKELPDSQSFSHLLRRSASHTA